METERSFTDLAKFPLAKMYSIHRMRDLENGDVEVTHIVRVEGLLAGIWWHLVGKNVAAGMPSQAKNMINRARNIDG